VLARLGRIADSRARSVHREKHANRQLNSPHREPCCCGKPPQGCGSPRFEEVEEVWMEIFVYAVKSAENGRRPR